MPVIYWSWDKAGDLAEKISNPEITQVKTWIDELENDTHSELTLNTRHTAPMGVEANKTLRTLEGRNALRIDIQRVVNSGRTDERTVTQFIKDGKVVTDQGRIDNFLTRKGTKKKGEQLIEVTRTITTYEAIWTLFAVQKTDTHNQVFVLNNPSFVLTAAEWKEVFEYTLEKSCSAIVTTGSSCIPNGFTSTNLVARV